MVKVSRGGVFVDIVAISDLTEKLENVSGLKFDAKLSTHIGLEYNFYIKMHAHECNAPSWTSLKERYAPFLKKASDLHTTMHELVRESDAISKIIREDVNWELVGRFPNSQEMVTFDVLLEQVGWLRASIEAAQENASNLYGGKPGREGHDTLHRLIWQLADIFEAAGGVASASYSDAKGKHDSPFLRFLNRFYRELPDSVRTHPESALGPQAKRVLEKRKNSKVK